MHFIPATRARLLRLPGPQLCSALLALLLSLGLAQPASAHGGAYRGSADSVPPTDGGGNTPGTGGGATTGGGGVPAGNQPGRTTSPRLPGLPALSNLQSQSVWQSWWGYNREAYLNLRGAVRESAIEAPNDELFLGRRDQPRLRDVVVPTADVIHGKVVPALLAVLQNERDNDLLSGTLIALAKIGDAPGARGHQRLAPRIAAFLDSENQEVAESAALALGILAEASSVPLLASLLEDSQRGRKAVARPNGVPLRTRAFAAYGLGLTAYRSTDRGLRQDVMLTLEKHLALHLGRSPGLGHLPRPDVAVACVTSMGIVRLAIDLRLPNYEGQTLPGRWNRQAQVESLLRLMEDDGAPDMVRAHAPVAAARLLAGVGDSLRLRKRTIERMSALLPRHSGRSRMLRQSVVIALGVLADCDADPVDVAARASLRKAALKDLDHDVRHFALLSLASVAARPGRGPGNPGLAEGREFLNNMLLEGPSSMRPWAALALGRLMSARLGEGQDFHAASHATLRAAFASARTPRERGSFGIALGLLGQPQDGELLLSGLNEVADAETSGYLCLSLGLCGARAARENIAKIIRTSRYRPELLRQAAIALGLLGDDNLVPDLIKMLQESTSLSAQASLAQALGSIGDARSIAPLLTLLSNPTNPTRARAFAAVALGIVGDKEAHPWNAKIAIGINYRANTMTLTNGQGSGLLEIL